MLKILNRTVCDGIDDIFGMFENTNPVMNTVNTQQKESQMNEQVQIMVIMYHVQVTFIQPLIS